MFVGRVRKTNVQRDKKENYAASQGENGDYAIRKGITISSELGDIKKKKETRNNMEQ